MSIKVAIFDADGVVINSPNYFSVQYEKEFGVFVAKALNGKL